jgi:7-cyano-7-deazaguanine synthase
MAKSNQPTTDNKFTMKKVVVLLSGGMDSAVLLNQHLHDGDEVRAIGFDYGQRHECELEFAENYAAFKGVKFAIADIACMRELLPGSSQTDSKVEVPEGKYDEDSMKATVVPNRNMIMLSVAIGHAIAHKFDAVSYAAHGGDHAIYPDCRPEFAEAVNACAALCDWHKVELIRPFINISKADICKRGYELGVDFVNTWSCYKGEDLHCGRCGTCVERREAFHLAGIADPTQYGPSSPTIEEMIRNDWHLPKP